MTWTTLISVEELATAIDHCVVVDCRHDLANPEAGARAYAEGHIPGARFVAMDTQLSAAKTGRNGRHPMPTKGSVRALLESLGVSDATQLILYDASGGMMASRLWWMARWVGHEQVAVLDGGLPAWQQARFPVVSELPTVKPGTLSARPALGALLDAAAVEQARTDASRLVVDARAPERYRGEVEPLDPVAGHIPGSVNRPSSTNVRPDGRFKPAPVLRAEFETLMAGRPASALVNSCGSGVSACHNLLAMAHAGLPGAALYGGSWSEWCSDPARPVATGPNP